MNSFTTPRDVVREPNINRKQARHLFLVSDHGSVAAKAFIRNRRLRPPAENGRYPDERSGGAVPVVSQPGFSNNARRAGSAGWSRFRSKAALNVDGRRVARFSRQMTAFKAWSSQAEQMGNDGFPQRHSRDPNGRLTSKLDILSPAIARDEDRASGRRDAIRGFFQERAILARSVGTRIESERRLRGPIPAC